MNFLIDSANKLISLLSMASSKEAKKELIKFKNFDGCLEYVRVVVYTLLDN